MADINELITLGIGTPATIKHFILFGLNIGAAVSVTTPGTRIYIPSASGRTNTPAAGDRIYIPPSSNRTDTPPA